MDRAVGACAQSRLEWPVSIVRLCVYAQKTPLSRLSSLLSASVDLFGTFCSPGAESNRVCVREIYLEREKEGGDNSACHTPRLGAASQIDCCRYEPVLVCGSLFHM